MKKFIFFIFLKFIFESLFLKIFYEKFIFENILLKIYFFELKWKFIFFYIFEIFFYFFEIDFLNWIFIFWNWMKSVKKAPKQIVGVFGKKAWKVWKGWFEDFKMYEFMNSMIEKYFMKIFYFFVENIENSGFREISLFRPFLTDFDRFATRRIVGSSRMGDLLRCSFAHILSYLNVHAKMCPELLPKRI